MHKCGHKGCTKQISDKYRFCFKHKDDPYMWDCKIHGRTIFKSGQCQICKSLKRPIYRIFKRHGMYFVGTSHIPITNNYNPIIFRYKEELTHRNITYAKNFISSKITQGPGCYGIFVRNNRSKNNIGKCLYVGQSVDVVKRIEQHKANIATARKEIDLKKHFDVKSDCKYTVPRMYYDIANKYSNDVLVFKKLISIPKPLWSQCDKKKAQYALSIFEQYCMDCYNPEENVIAARNSNF